MTHSGHLRSPTVASLRHDKSFSFKYRTLLSGGIMARIFRCLGVVCVMATWMAITAAAKTQLDIWCDGQDGASNDLIISSCTTLIQSGKSSREDLAINFSNRGFAYQQ